MELLEFQILLDAVNDGSPSCMDAKVLDTALEVGHVVFDLGVPFGVPENFAELAADDGKGDGDLLGEREHVGAEGCEVFLHALSGNL